MDLRRLKYFIAVGEELNFNRAAQRLHIAQPGLSKQVQQLERELGVALLDRSRRSVSLTEAGRLLLDEANRLLKDVDQVAHRVHQVGSGSTGRVSMDFPPSVSSRVLPMIIREFRQQCPRVQLTLREADPDGLIRAVQRGLTDVGFVYVPFRDEDALRRETLLCEPFVVALPRRHPLASAERVELAELADDDFVLNFAYNTAGLHHKVVQLCEEAGFVPQVVQEAWLMQTTLSLVSAGLGVTLVPASMQGLRRDGVTYKPMVGCPDVVELDLLWRCDNSSPAVRAFVEVARQWAGSARGVGA